MSLKVVIVTPEKTLLDEPAEMVVVTLFDGESGILPGHARMIGRLGFGELRFSGPSGTQNYYVDGGFVQVADNEVNILTGRAMPVSKIDRAAAERDLAEAEKIQPENPEQLAARNRSIDQAKAQLRLAGRS